MPIDPRIALGVQQSTFDPAAAMQNALAIRNAQQVNQLNQMKLAAEQQAAQETAGLQNYLTSANLSTPEGLSGLYRYGTAGAATAKSIAERRKLEEEARTSAATGKKQLMDEAKARQEWVSQSLQNMATNPSNENIIAWTQDAVINGYMSNDQAASKVQQLTSMPVEQRAQFFKDQGATFASRSEAERRAAQTKGEAEQRAETERAHRASENIERDKLKQLQDKANKGDTTADAGKELLTSQVISLRDTYDALSEKGGIVDTKAPWYKNLGAWVSSTGPGQTVGKALGTDTQSLRNTIAQSRPLLLNAIKQATGMTAKQMDSNVELQMYLRAATDPTADIQSNRKALQKLNDLFGLGIDLGPIESSATPSPALGGAGMGAGTPPTATGGWGKATVVSGGK